jgi:hypothetical protein
MSPPDDICICSHTLRDHSQTMTRGRIVNGSLDKVMSGLCLVAGCHCNGFVRPAVPALPEGPVVPALPEGIGWWGFV